MSDEAVHDHMTNQIHEMATDLPSAEQAPPVETAAESGKLWYMEYDSMMVAAIDRLQALSGAPPPPPSGEAGFSITVKLLDEVGNEHLVTFRGRDAKDWPVVLAEATAFKRMVMQDLPDSKRWEPLGSRGPARVATTPAPGSGTPITIPNIDGNGTSETRVPVSDPADPGANPDADGKGHFPGERYIISVAKLKIEPRDNGKIAVSFIPYLTSGAEGSYADFTDPFKTAEEWTTIFKELNPGWQLEHFQRRELNVKGAFRVEVLVSDRKNSAGNYFRNFNKLLPPAE